MTGTSLPVKSQGRPKGSPNKQDSITGSAIHDGLNEEANDSDPEDALRSLTNRSKAKHDKLKGLSKKERFEALGMDESWSEYNALLMNKPSPGVYVTPQGKRRPAGKKQGRPRSSRIAVFKSAKLVDLPWFVKEKSDSDHETIAPIIEETAVPEEMNGIQASEEPQQVPQPRASRKRTSAFNHTDSPSGTKRPRRVAEKQTKRGDPKDNQAVSSGTDAAISVSEEPALQANVNSTQADVTGKHPLSNEDTRTPTKRQRISSPERADSANFAHSPTPTGPSTPMVSDQHGPGEAPKGKKKAQTKKTADKSGGSINLLRRKIVMDIVEKAGGAYPSGHEIWYPFVTEWMRMKFKEKPDVRTVKGAVKHLVDAGRLRQLTFSGKDPSGVMVTKTMITKPEMSPDDPLVKEIQAKVLATDRAHPKVSYSPNVFLDPTISKHSSRATGQKHELRVEQGTTVRLQSKPAFVLASEKRRERAFERALYRRMVGPSKTAADDDDDDVNIPGAVRLMKIKRPPAAEEFAPGSHTTQTIILRPKRSANPRRQRAGRNQATRRILQKSSSLGHSALLMRPQQKFHSSTGTFATQSIVGRISRQQKNPAAMPDSIHGLSKLATSSLHQQDFHSMNDIISEWEMDHKHILDAAHPDDPYISQTVRDSFYGTPIGGEIRFDVDRPSRTARPVPTPMQTRKRTETKQKQQSERRLEAADLSTPTRARFQPTLPVPPRTSKRRTFQPIPESLLRKIMLAIVAVRVLTGGTEARHVDWEFVAACFPGHDAPSLIDRARNVLNRNRLQMLKMQSDFQSRFLEAYANDEVPAINYEDLENYPWPTLIEWANFQLEVSTSERAPSLPSTREQFDRIFDLREEPIPTADEIFTTTVGMTVNYRRGVMARTPFAVSLDSGKDTKRNSQRQMDLKWEEVAKSFVRANIVTPEETYDPAKSKTILERFGDQRIQFAVDSLIRDRVIGQSNRGRVIPGRNYDITDHLLQQLNRRRLIECGILKHAAQFKMSTLDLQLRDQASAEVQYNAEDGHILAIINLFACGRVQLFPRGAPRDRFGLVDDGYLTRQMDKTKLRFAVDVRPTKSYVYGNPIQERVDAITPPSLSLPEADIPQMIPLWMDLNGHLVEPLWEMSISSVLGSLALREGLSAKGISSMVKPAMAPWEIEAMLSWLTDVGVVEGLEVESEKRWKVKEWWWMAISR